VSNRFIRSEVGVDNEEAVNDGLIRWKQAGGATGDPRFEEAIEGEFASDDVRLTMEKQAYGPQGMLLCPPVDAAFKAVVVSAPPPPKEVPREQLGRPGCADPAISISRRSRFSVHAARPNGTRRMDSRWKRTFWWKPRNT
jgi:hypothetical protein